MKNLIYKILELFFQNGINTKISGISIRMPFRFRKYYERDYEIEHIEFFKQHIKPNSVILDIGAQLGLMSKVFYDLSGAGGRIFAFEPVPFTHEVLCRVIDMNNMHQVVKPIQKAVSDHNGKVTFYVSKIPLDPANSLVDYKRKHNFTSIEVSVISVDEFVIEQDLSHIDFIKIDAEGAEYQVLKGAEKTIQKHRPFIHLALHPDALKNFNSSLSQIFSFIVAHNYEPLYKSKTISEQEFTAMRNLFDVELIPKQH